MSDLSTVHRGYVIRYNENMDEWSCLDLGISEKTLSKAKEKVNAELLKVRKQSALDCFYIDNSYSDRSPVQLIEATAIDFREKQARDYSSSSFAPSFKTVAEVGVMVCKSSALGKKRSKSWEPLGNLAPISDETLAALAIAQRRHRELKKAREAYDNAVKAIPRLSVGQLGDLARIAEEQGEKNDGS